METFNVATIILLCSSYFLHFSAGITIVSQPEHSLKTLKSYCVSTNKSQTLTWTTPYNEFYYKNNGDQFDDNTMLFVPNHWHMGWNHDLYTGPILDPRWQSFQTFMSRNMKKVTKHLTRPMKIYFEFSFSIKYEEDAEISFSFNQTLIQTLSFKNNVSTITTYLYTRRWYTSVKQKRSSEIKQFILSSHDGWNHFTIRYDVQTKQYSMLLNGNIIMEDYSIPFYAFDQIDMQSKEGAIWKLHTYDYYRTTSNLSETMFVEMLRPRDGKLCFSAYFYFEHELTVELRLDSNIYKQQTFQNDKTSWKLIQMEATVDGRKANRFYSFWIKYREDNDIFFSHLKLNSYCETGPNKINTNIRMEDLQLVSCESLHNKNELVTMDEFNETIVSSCSDDEFGNDCIKCKSVFGTDYCLKTMTCDEISKCYCQPGFNGEYCSSECVDSFGYNCAEKCGKCMYDDRCDSITGHCLYGCQNYYVESICKETDLPYLKEPPHIHRPFSHNSCEIIFNPDMYEGRKKPESYKFQFYSGGWKGNEEPDIITSDNIVKLDYDGKSNFTIRIVLCVKGECMEGDEVPTMILHNSLTLYDTSEEFNDDD